MRLHPALLATSALLAIASTTALADPAAIRSSAPGRVCTEIGCQSGVFLTAGSYLAAHASVARVEVCSLGRCRSIRRGQPTVVGQPLVLPVAAERRIAVTVTALDSRGHAVLRRRLVAKLRRGQPNGPDCPPVCFQLNLVLSRSGALSAN